MLCNNLDPEVAEDPTKLVVYGGSGRAARSHEALRRDRRGAARPERRRDAAGPVGQAGGGVPDAPRRAARADRQLAARAAVRDLGRVPAARGRGADDVRADDRRLVDLHRHPGHPAGHVPDLRGRRREALGLTRPGRAHHPHRRPGRDGRRAAAGRVAGRRRQPERRGRPAPDRAPPGDALPGRGRRRPGRRRRPRAACRRAGQGASRSACWATPPTCSPSLPPRRALRPGHRPDLGPRHAERLRAAGHGATRTRSRCASATPTSTSARRGRRRSPHVEAMVAFQDAGSHVFDYGNNLRTEARDAGFEHAFDFPGFVPAYIRPLFCRGAGPVPLGRALRRSRATSPRSTAALLEAFPDDALLQRWLKIAPERIAFQGLPAGSAGWATATGRRPACCSTTSSAAARCRRRS